MSCSFFVILVNPVMFTMSTCQKFSFISRIKYFENMDFRRPEFIFANVWARLIYFFFNTKYKNTNPPANSTPRSIRPACRGSARRWFARRPIGCRRHKSHGQADGMFDRRRKWLASAATSRPKSLPADNGGRSRNQCGDPQQQP